MHSECEHVPRSMNIGLMTFNLLQFSAFILQMVGSWSNTSRIYRWLMTDMTLKEQPLNLHFFVVQELKCHPFGGFRFSLYMSNPGSETQVVLPPPLKTQKCRWVSWVSCLARRFFGGAERHSTAKALHGAASTHRYESFSSIASSAKIDCRCDGRDIWFRAGDFLSNGAQVDLVFFFQRRVGDVV